MPTMDANAKATDLVKDLFIAAKSRFIRKRGRPRQAPSGAFGNITRFIDLLPPFSQPIDGGLDEGLGG